MVRRNSVLVSTNMNGINETFETFETIQIREIVEIFPPNVFIKYKKETEVNELESLFSHVIETDVISYPSFVKPEDQVSLGKFLLLQVLVQMTPNPIKRKINQHYLNTFLKHI